MLRWAWQSIVEIPILPPLFDNGIALFERRQPLPRKAPVCPDPSGQSGQQPTAINHRKQPSIHNLREFSLSPGSSAIFPVSGQRGAISGNRLHVPRSNPDRNHRSRPRRRQDSAAEPCGSLEKRPQSAKNNRRAPARPCRDGPVWPTRRLRAALATEIPPQIGLARQPGHRSLKTGTFMIGICQGETEIPRVLLAAEPVSWKQRCRHRSAGTNGLASLSQPCIAVPRLHAPSADSSGNHTFLCGLALWRSLPIRTGPPSARNRSTLRELTRNAAPRRSPASSSVPSRRPRPEIDFNRSARPAIRAYARAIRPSDTTGRGGFALHILQRNGRTLLLPARGVGCATGVKTRPPGTGRDQI